MPAAQRDVRAYLVRIGIDQTFGGWNAPVDPRTNAWVYVPIPEAAPQLRELATPYDLVSPALVRFAGAHPDARMQAVQLPARLARSAMHLDPDFAALTYGDDGLRRGRRLTALGRGDVVVFYAGLRPISPCAHRLVYALVGLYRIAEVVRVSEVPAAQWGENAHTRRRERRGTDVIIRADPRWSGRLRRCVPIGEFREGAYRITREVLDAWGGLSCRGGYVQRSAVPPRLLDPGRFLAWFASFGGELVRSNHG